MKFSDPHSDHVHANKNSRTDNRLIGMVIFGALIVGGIALAPHAGQPAAATTPATTTCASDWTKCADNRDMANNYDGWSRAKVDCKYEANDRAKYGTPKWPWLPFSSFYPGTDYNTGIVTLIEGDAQFQNGFGAMVRSSVTCEYDLRTKKVINVSIGER